ncbi:unnamed protein product [Xylocopa violacea]|uniref:RRM domain-containing protein n=1 Tax=Xylocopa violacea TaxID=135666 RepID=A0ABP1P4G0_XYLVO
MVKAEMVKNTKKRSVSESDVVGKKVQMSGSNNKNYKKKKTENGDVQNGQSNKQIKKDVPKIIKNEKNTDKDTTLIQNPIKNEISESSLQKNKKRPMSDVQKLKLLNKRQELREKRKESRQTKYRGLPVDLSVKQIKEKIQLIESRGKLTKSSKRKLAALRKKLRIDEGTEEPKEVTQKQTTKGKNEKSVEVTKSKQVQKNEQKKNLQGKLETKTSKENKKKDAKQNNSLLLKKKNEKEEEDDDDDDDDDELSEDEDESDIGGEEEDEEDEEEEDEEEEEEEEEEEDDDDDDDEEEDEEDVEDEDNKQVKNKENPKEKGKSKDMEGDGKKKRYILFVGNLPYTITSEELKKHFLTKVSQIVDIRIPKKDANTSRGFAYVELANNVDYEKALSLNHTFVNGRRINVQYSGTDKKAGVAKNFKLHALQKSGKLAGGWNKNNQKYGGFKGKQNTRTTKT